MIHPIFMTKIMALAQDTSGAQDNTSAVDYKNFSQALDLIKEGLMVAREGWNGKGMHIQAQLPDENSKMGRPYIFIKTVDGTLVPWAVSHGDLFAEDWFLVE